MRKVFFTSIALATIILACKKDKPTPIELPKQVYLDIPFELTSKADCYMLDTFYDSTANKEIINEIFISLNEIEDFRAFGYGCMNSTGGHAEVSSSIKFNNDLMDVCIKSFFGCTGNNEWDTINTFAPRCIIGEYKLFLLKLNPATGISLDESLPEKIEDYTVKYVFKRN